MKVLEDKGYKCWKTDQDEYSTTKHYQRRADKDQGFNYPLCQCNDKLCINVVEHDFTIHGTHHHSFTLKITAENGMGDWCNIEIYGVNPEELKNKLDVFEKKLLNMWKAFNQ